MPRQGRVEVKAERLTTLFAHVRRLKRDNDQMRICAAKLSGSSYTSLQKAIAMVTLPEEEEPLEKGEEASLEKGQALKKDIAAKLPLQKEKLLVRFLWILMVCL